ncbi:MAG: RHS repeat-associated core domain-containing protein, partial [Rubritalea sp.]|uniref:RHS repeat-associated core domain-containing protein n=1 Tax=Rubritalea sp. TaxID=2109375 RepID=UPI003242E2DE
SSGRIQDLEGYKTKRPFRWYGQYVDAETNLYYYRFRYFDCGSGLYTSSGPIGIAGKNPTLYSYFTDVHFSVDSLLLKECKLERAGDGGELLINALRAR